MTFAVIAERCSDLPVLVCWRVMKVSTSGYYQRMSTQVTDWELDEAHRANTAFDIWTMSRHFYGSPRVRHELRLGMGRHASKTQAERWMRACGAVGIHYPSRRAKNGCTRRDGSDPNPDLVARRFDPDGPDRLWVMDVTEHPTREGKVYLAVVIGAWSRRVVGWSIADHIRGELVTDALQRPPGGAGPRPGKRSPSDHGSVYTSWLFANRPPRRRHPRLDGQHRDAYDNSVAEAFFSSLQRELLDQRRHWDTRDQLTGEIFEWIECWYKPAPPPQQQQRPQPHRLRDHQRGMITHTLAVGQTGGPPSLPCQAQCGPLQERQSAR